MKLFNYIETFPCLVLGKIIYMPKIQTRDVISPILYF